MATGVHRRTGPGTAPGPAWAGAAAACTVAVASLLFIGPLTPMLLLGMILALLVAAFRPKAFALLAVLVIVLSTPIQNVLGSLGSYADEGVVALAAVAFGVRRLVTEGRLIWLPGSGWFLGYLVAGLLSSALAGVSAATAAPTAFIALKGVVFAFALAQLPWTREDLVTVIRLGIAAVMTVAISGALNLIAPAAWAQLTTGRAPISYIGPIPAINGIFQHPAAFSRFSGVLAVGALVYGLVVRRSLANAVLLAVSGGLAVLTFQVKSIVGLLATLGAVGARFLRPVGIATLLCTAPLAALIAAPPLVSLIGGDIEVYLVQDSARSALTEGGLTVAAQYFPLGAGFGRYGSSTAAEDYSPLYYSLGFPDRYGLGPGPDSGQFLNDSQWPAIYGEAGWLGAVCFAAGLGCMLVSLLRPTAAGEEPLVRWMRVAGIGWIILLLVESAAAPVFVSAPSFPFAFVAAGIIASFRVAARDDRSRTGLDDPTRRRGTGRHRWPSIPRQ
ncbi:hypothetical protein E4P41_00040 [Geodermatophilus sp. DF01-2]|uniref:hypothetical protein n=1 Tax=Geodermatophilus sp. DF01-2 TaxID=2559610 RepID=UPI0010746219|nr:hypothetical protein [Geodermatophilus sp. DF01_2]TFV64675.1 hypothetical protein E4P41_00040 [Geodermatophilus sp. DF01_2]